MGFTTNALHELVHPLTGFDCDLDPVLDLVGDSRVVLLGEATHGTHEFYQLRSRITQRLVDERGFNAVAAEADWPDALRVNRYVRQSSDDTTARAALGGFRRFPAWMWRNGVVADLVEWMRGHNEAHGARVGFFGLDLYSLHASIAAVLRYLYRVAPDAAREARERYRCFEEFGRDSQAYGRAVAWGGMESCENDVVRQLRDMQARASELARLDGATADDEYFYAEQNARLVKNAEAYYRTMYEGYAASWNLRDEHMAETLQKLLLHLDKQHGEGKVVVWAHNSHLGDARATERKHAGILSLGQLVRQEYGPDCVTVGFTTHAGTVTAADEWDNPARTMVVRPSIPGSIENLFHRVGVPVFFLNMRGEGRNIDALNVDHYERAIGVIYRPHTEMRSHCFKARVVEQFDAMIHVDMSRALQPLEVEPVVTVEAPETYPSAL